MWYDDLKEDYTWSSLWYGYIICSNCYGIRRFKGNCPGCGQTMPTPKTYQVQIGDEIHEVEEAYVGGEGRYEDYVYLTMLEREWLREITDADRFLGIFAAKRPSPRAVIILIFWTYFETRIERLMKHSMHNLPTNISADLLKKNSAISDRLYRLYKILFDTSYFDDLTESGYGTIAVMLKRLQEKRNDFMHGAPEAIDDPTIEELIGNLKLEHESWIAIYNKRAVQK
jgi:hypothetical protein